MASVLTQKSRANLVSGRTVLASKFWVRSLLAATALSAPASIAFLAQTSIAQAQQLPRANPNAQLLLKADELIYDNDAQTVTAVGNVQLDFDGYNVVADRVSYNQKTRRVKAFGNVEILEPNGNRIFAREIDLTDDFGEGFVNALRVETPDNTRFAADSAERFAGQKTVFNHGVYTACEPCRKKPEKPPLWQIKAEKVILNGVEKTVTYRNASFEIWGVPIAYVPYFKHADPSVKRQTGFLTPEIGFNERLGLWYRQPYFLATGDSHDLTFRPVYYSKQGFLADVEWRQALDSGTYSFRLAGIRQERPERFDFAPDNNVRNRGLLATRGQFKINPKWAFGWNILAQTDQTFARSYRIRGWSDETITNELFLRGIHNRSYFDLSAYQFLIQRSNLTNVAFQTQDQQGLIRPSLDYNYVTTERVTGGQINFDVNVTSIRRDERNVLFPITGDNRTHGLEGDSTRVSADLSWKKTYVTLAGLALTPSLSVRGDWTSNNVGAAAAQNDTPVLNIGEGSQSRFMPTAGLEVSYPFLARAAGSSHVIEPVANLFLRPDLANDSVLPNEDAQSLVFDATTLFQRDKFSGYDRIESGTRANLGIRYSGQFANGFSLTGVFGQSYHIAGQNPYARTDDLTNTGEESGLETDRSDFVAGLGANFNNGFSLNVNARFDERTFDVRRTDTIVNFAGTNLSFAANYAFIAAQPDYASPFDRQQVGFSTTLRVSENWSVFGRAQYDFTNDIATNATAGFSYHDECFTFTLAFNQERAQDGASNESVGFRFQFRTLGGFGASVSGEDVNDIADRDIF